MPQGSHMKGGKDNPKKPKITKPSKRGSSITKKTPKKTEKKKLQKALERTIKSKVETELRARAGGSGLIDKKAPAAAAAPKPKNVRKGKKK